MFKRNLKGITLLEAFLAAFIFIVSVSAIFITMTALRKPAVNNERAVAAAMTLRNVLEDLRSKVDSRDIDTGALSPSPPPHHLTVTSSDVTYEIYYNVTLDASGGRSVEANISWPDVL